MSQPEDLMARLRESIDQHKRPVTSSAQTPEPTDERDLWAGIAINRGVGIADAYDIADALLAHHARALAAAVTAEREKQQEAIEAAAKSVEHRMKHTRMALVSGMWAARRIREVSR